MKEEAKSTEGEDQQGDREANAENAPSKAADTVSSEAKSSAEEKAATSEENDATSDVEPAAKDATSEEKDATSDAEPAAKPTATKGKPFVLRPPAKPKATRLERFSMLMFALGALGLALAKIRDRTHAHEFNLDGFRVLAIAITAAVALVIVVVIARRGREGRAWGSIATDVATTLLGTYLFASSGLDAANRMIPTKWERFVGIVQEHRSENGQTHAKVWIVDRGVDTYFWRPLPLELEAKIDVYVRRGIFGMRIGTLAPPS